jgi:hypothetical protein
VYRDGPFRRLQGASRREEVLLAQLMGMVAPYYWEKPEKGPRDGLYVPTLSGGGLGARPDGVENRCHNH